MSDNTYNYKWLVKIKNGLFMAGIHRFRTKKLAEEFVEKWNRTPDKAPLAYADLPTIEKAGRNEKDK